MRSKRRPTTAAILALLVLGALGTGPGCGGGGGGGAPAAPPPSSVAPSISVHPQSQGVEKGGTVTFSVVASGTPAPSYQWRRNGANLSAATSATLALTNVQGQDRGDYTVQVSNSAGSVTSNPATLTVHDLFDDFSHGDAKWTFLYCNRSISNNELSMVSTDNTAQSVAQSSLFSTWIDLPWVVKGDVAIVGSPGVYTGLSVMCDDSGAVYAIKHMWLALVGNSSSYNWIWVWWVPSLTNTWLPWDSTCRGQSSAIHLSNQMNSLELGLDSGKRATLKANGVTLLSGHDAILQMQDMVSRTLMVKVKQVTLRGANGTTTKWDNISMSYLGSSALQAEPGALQPPPLPSARELEELMGQLDRGEKVTLRDLLEQKWVR